MSENVLTTSATLYTDLGGLAEAIDLKLESSITLFLTSLRNSALSLAKDKGIKPEEWKYAHKPHDVFIEPVEVHAFIKLQSSIACLINAMYLNDAVLFKHAIFDVEHYIDKIASVFTQ